MNSSSVGKNGSIVDFGQHFGRHTSFSMNYEDSRRKTEVMRQQPFPSGEPLPLDRLSSIEEGSVNPVNSAPIAKHKMKKHMSICREESREDYETVVTCEDQLDLKEKKQSGSGSDRAHPALMRSFHAAEEHEPVPFSSAQRGTGSETLKRGEEDCDDVEDTEETGLVQMIKQNSNGITNKNQALQR